MSDDPVSREKVLEAVLAEMDRYSADTFGKHDRDDMIAAINAVHAAPPAQGWEREELAEAISTAWNAEGHDAATVDGHRLSIALAHSAARTALAKRPGWTEEQVKAAKAELEIQWGTALICDSVVDANAIDMRAILQAAAGAGKPT